MYKWVGDSNLIKVCEHLCEAGFIHTPSSPIQHQSSLFSLSLTDQDYSTHDNLHFISSFWL